MPQMIEHIDAIARRKQRDVLFVTFCGNAAYRKFEAFLEYPDGSLPYPHMCILVIGLDYAMKNAHRDKLGF